jgi:light-harvesting protein B-800-850 alpha chain
MNQGRIWCVVSPTVGLPLFLGSVTGLALCVHAAVLTNTTWFGTYWQGGKARSAEDTTGRVAVPAKADGGYSIMVTPVAAASGNSGSSFVVTVVPNGQAPVKAEPAAADKSSDARPIKSASAE